jgi:DNA-binding Lrp family transcriptional regulator
MVDSARALRRDGQSDPVVMDAFDHEIVALLTVDARLSIRAIARTLNRSPGAVGERLAKLESSGVIAGYYADIDYARLGYTHLLLGIQLTDDALLDRCLADISALAEVQRVWTVTGTWALIAEAHVRDAIHLRELLQTGIRSVAGVQHTEAMIVLETVAAPSAARSLGEAIALPARRPPTGLR